MSPTFLKEREKNSKNRRKIREMAKESINDAEQIILIKSRKFEKFAVLSL